MTLSSRANRRPTLTLAHGYTKFTHEIIYQSCRSCLLKTNPPAWQRSSIRGPQLGLVAQEVEPVLPELVSTTKDAEQTKGLNYVGLVPVLVNAIQEQQQQLEQYRTQLTQQQQRARQPRSEVATLKRLLCRQFPRAAVCKASQRVKGR